MAGLLVAAEQLSGSSPPRPLPVTLHPLEHRMLSVGGSPMQIFHLQIDSFLYIWKYNESTWHFLNCKHTEHKGPGQDLWEHPVTLQWVTPACHYLL